MCFRLRFKVRQLVMGVPITHCYFFLSISIVKLLRVAFAAARVADDAGGKYTFVTLTPLSPTTTSKFRDILMHITLKQGIFQFTPDESYYASSARSTLLWSITPYQYKTSDLQDHVGSSLLERALFPGYMLCQLSSSSGNSSVHTDLDGYHNSSTVTR